MHEEREALAIAESSDPCIWRDGGALENSKKILPLSKFMENGGNSKMLESSDYTPPLSINTQNSGNFDSWEEVMQAAEALGL